MVLTTKALTTTRRHSQGLLQPGVSQPGHLTTRGLTTRDLRTKESYNQGFLQPGVLQPGLLTTKGLSTRAAYN